VQAMVGVAVRDMGVLGESIFVDFLASLWDLAFLFGLFEGVWGERVVGLGGGHHDCGGFFLVVAICQGGQEW
jgi:hypothetical protein